MSRDQRADVIPLHQSKSAADRFDGVPLPEEFSRTEADVREIDDSMAANPEPSTGVSEPTPDGSEIRYRAPDLAAVIERLSSMPWIDLRLGESVVVRARIGMVIALMGPTGSGKSSAAMQMAAYHARHVGPVVYSSLELDADVGAGRIVGQTLSASWAGVMTLTEVTAADVARVLAELPRLVILDGDRADLANIERAVAVLRAEYPGEPVLVAIDYVQIMQGEAREERVRIAQITESIRRMAQRLGVVVIMVSQTSRASAQGLRNGEVVGVDTTTTGAESAQIERAASVTLAIGSLVEREDGTMSADISIGKSRMGGGDKVIPATYTGRTGVWSIVGPAVTGAERRAEQATAKSDGKRERAALAVLGFLSGAERPQTRREIQVATGLTNNDRAPVLASLMADGKVAAVMTGRKVGGYWPLWTPDKAKAAGMRIEEIES